MHFLSSRLYSTETYYLTKNILYVNDTFKYMTLYCAKKWLSQVEIEKLSLEIQMLRLLVVNSFPKVPENIEKLPAPCRILHN